jgi:hypothetical protein
MPGNFVHGDALNPVAHEQLFGFGKNFVFDFHQGIEETNRGRKTPETFVTKKVSTQNFPY